LEAEEIEPATLVSRRSFQRPSAAVELFAATVGFSSIGVFVKLIHGDPLAMTFGRAIFATLGLGFLFAIRRQKVERVSPKDIPLFLGMVLGSAGNWLLYFWAIKVSTLSVAVVSLFTYPVLAAIFEPIVYKEPHDRFEVLSGLVVLLGVFFVMPEFSLANNLTVGALLGILSAVSFTIRNLIGRSILPRYGSLTPMLWQFAGSILLFAPFGTEWVARWSIKDWLLLALIGAGLTTLSQTLFFANLRRVTSSYASLMTSSQPVMTVGLAVLFLHEQPTSRTLVGGAIIVASVVAVAVRKRSVSETRRVAT